MSKKRRAKQGGKKNGFKQNLLQQVVSIFDKNPSQTLSFKQLSKAFGFKDLSNKKLLHIILQQLTAQNKLYETKRDYYKLRTSDSLIEGRVDMTSRGAAYIVVEDSDKDIYISARNTGTALHGDKVRVNLFSKGKSRKPEGD